MSERRTMFTIGFTGTSAEGFFGRLQDAGVRRVVDVRLNNVSQLAGFAKRSDLEWFLRKIASIEYVHVLEFAPTPELLAAFRAGEIDWTEYARRFEELMVERRVEELVSCSELEGACLLCSEPGPEQCHRRLVAEHLERAWGGSFQIVHL